MYCPVKVDEKKVLGSGGYGVVYRGTFEGNAVAVKEFKNSGDARKKEQKREMEEHLRLDHENVLKLLHVDDSRAKTYKLIGIYQFVSIWYYIGGRFQFHPQTTCPGIVRWYANRLLRGEIQGTYAVRCHSFISNRHWIALHPLPKFSSSRCETGKYSHLNHDTRPNEIVRFWICEENKSSWNIYAEWIERN